MEWTEVKITVDSKNLDTAGAIAQMASPSGIYIEDYSHLREEVEEIAHMDLIDAGLLKKDPRKAVIHLYLEPEDRPEEALAYLEERLRGCGNPSSDGSIRLPARRLDEQLEKIFLSRPRRQEAS